MGSIDPVYRGEDGLGTAVMRKQQRKKAGFPPDLGHQDNSREAVDVCLIARKLICPEMVLIRGEDFHTEKIEQGTRNAGLLDSDRERRKPSGRSASRGQSERADESSEQRQNESKREKGEHTGRSKTRR